MYNMCGRFLRDRKKETMQEKRWEWGGGENRVIWTLAHAQPSESMKIVFKVEQHKQLISAVLVLKYLEDVNSMRENHHPLVSCVCFKGEVQGKIPV
jgi:hypothetical protein